MKWIFKYKIITAILVLATLIRFWQLGAVPPSPDWDEAALGYNAYSLLQTGRDEYGVFLPRTLRSFDDYKPPLYAYLVVPSVFLFGLDVWSVRLPSAIFGVLAVLGTYLLVLELLKITSGDRKKGEYEFGHEVYASLTAFLLAISPWHIQFSRIAFEANVGVTLNIWLLYTLFCGLTRPKWLIASAFLSGLSLYAYHSERIFVPLILLVVLLIWRGQIFKKRHIVFSALVVGLLTALPLVPVVFDKTSMARLAGTSALADQTGLLFRSVQKLQDDIKEKNVLGYFFDNRRVVYAQKIFEGYASHFSLRWLFLTGDNDRHHAPDHGLLYLWELPFLLIGMFYIARRGGKLAWFLFSWFFIAPIAASPTSETPHAIRTLVYLPTFQVFTASGLLSVWLWLLTHVKKTNGTYKTFVYRGYIGIGLLSIGMSIAYYFHMYFVHMNIEYSKFWQFGYKEAFEYAVAHKNTVEKIVVSTKLEQPHMFFLFYSKYDPRAYLANGGTATGGFAETRNAFDIYEFRPIDWVREIHDGTVLYIGTPKEIPTGSEHSIYYLNGQEAIRIGR